MRTTTQAADPGENDLHEASDSYATSDEPSVSAGTAPEVDDDAARCGSTSSNLDVQPLLDRVTSHTGEKTSLK